MGNLLKPSVMELEVKDTDYCEVIAGTHKGKRGVVVDSNVSRTGYQTITIIQDNGVKFKTLAKNVNHVYSF